MKKHTLALIVSVLLLSALFPKDFPHKIVSLVPAATEILFAVEADSQIAARTDFCTFPAEAARIPSVGGFDGKTISLEKILTFQPDLVCLAQGMHDHLIKPLEKLGIDCFVLSAESLNDVLNEIALLAKRVGKRSQGDLCVTRIKEQLRQAREKNDGREAGTFRVYWEVSAEPYFTCGANSFINDLLENLGAKNIFSDLNLSYPQVSEESIVSRAPNIIIFPDYTGNGNTDSFKARRNWRQIPAVSAGNIFPVDADLFSRPGPRIGQMALDLADILCSCKRTSESAPQGTAR